jgi:hypothetical protein
VQAQQDRAPGRLNQWIRCDSPPLLGIQCKTLGRRRAQEPVGRRIEECGRPLERPGEGEVQVQIVAVSDLRCRLLPRAAKGGSALLAYTVP